MTSVPSGGGARRYPFDGPALPVLLYDRTKSIPALVRSAQLQQFIFEFSDIKSMKLCSDRFPCQRRICPWCARRVAAKTRRETRDVVSGYQSALDLVLSSKSNPTLREAWLAQHGARTKFMANAWLSKNSDAWLRETELTVDESGWHVHDHLLVFLDSNDHRELTELGRVTIARWLDSARRAGVRAAPTGQHAKVHRGTHERLLYATKGMMRQKRAPSELDGYSPADVLAMYVAGEVRGQEWWKELDAHFSKRLRWRARGGAFAATPEQHDWSDLLDIKKFSQWPNPTRWTANPPPRENRAARDRERFHSSLEERDAYADAWAELDRLKAADALAEEARLLRVAALPVPDYSEFAHLLD